jgi:hypothetical protein
MGQKPLSLTKAEAQQIVDALATYDENEKAAAALGLSDRTFRRRLKLAQKMGIESRIDSPAALKRTIRALKDQIAQSDKNEDTAAAIRQEVFKLAAYTPEPPKWLAKPAKTSGIRGCPMTIWSDWHFGEVVRRNEVGGVNEFNAAIAARRVEKLVDKTIELCFMHMGSAEIDYPGVVVMLGGDLISGDIHEELAVSNDRTPYQAVNDLTDIIAAALTRMADLFGRVFVPCVVGNHGRGTHKPRMKGRIFTSFEWLIYCALERHFAGDKRVSFLIPEETDAYFSVYGHRFLLTHGDSLGVKGGDGIIGALGPIMRGSIKVSRSEAQIGRDFDTIVMGHWHQYLTLPGLIVNNSLKGYDEFARLALRAPYSRPSQALWFVHPQHGITAHWQVYLEAAASAKDNRKWLEILK